MNERLRRSDILRGRREVLRVLRDGHRVAGEQLYLRWRRRTAGCRQINRTGGTAVDDRVPPRRVAFLLARGIDGAVRRNRLKRRLRDLYRINKSCFPAGCDYLVHATAGAADLEFNELARNLSALTRGLGGAGHCD